MAQDNLNKFLYETGVTSGLPTATRTAQAKLALGITPSNKEIQSLVNSQFYQNQRLESVMSQGQKDLRFGFQNTPQAQVAKMLQQQRQGPAATASQLMGQPQPVAQPAAQAAPQSGPSSINIAGVEFPATSAQVKPSIDIAGRSFPATGGQVRGLSDEYINKAIDYISPPQQANVSQQQLVQPNPALLSEVSTGKLIQPPSSGGGMVSTNAPLPSSTIPQQPFFGGVGKPESVKTDLLDYLKGIGKQGEAEKSPFTPAGDANLGSQPVLKPEATPVSDQVQAPAQTQPQQVQQPAMQQPAQSQFVPQQAAITQQAPVSQPYNPLSSGYAPLISESIYGKQARAQAEHQQKMQLETYKANVNAQSKALRDSFYAANQMMGLKEKELQIMDKKLQQQFAANPSPVQIVDLGNGRKEAFVMTSHGHWTHTKADPDQPSGFLTHPVDQSTGKPIEHIWIDAVTKKVVNTTDPLMQQVYSQGGGAAPAAQSGGKPSAQAKGGKQLSQQEAAAILSEAGGDKAKARQIATSRGYSL